MNSCNSRSRSSFCICAQTEMKRNRQVEGGWSPMISGLIFSISPLPDPDRGLACYLSLYELLHISLPWSHCYGHYVFWVQWNIVLLVSFIGKSSEVHQPGFLVQCSNFTLIQPHLSLENCRGRQFPLFQIRVISEISPPLFWLLALWDGTNLAVDVPVVLQQRVQSLFLWKLRLLAFKHWFCSLRLPLLSRHCMCVAAFSMRVSPHQPCLENHTISECLVTWYWGNLGTCVFLWKRHNMLKVVVLCSLTEAFQASWFLWSLFLAHG